MSSSTGGEEDNISKDYANSKNKTKSGIINRVRVSSPSPFSSPSLPSQNQNPPKTMEEVWKDINLASLHDHTFTDQDFSLTTPRHRNPSTNPNFILQDFLAGPFNKDQPARVVSGSRGDSGIYDPPVRPPPTVLSLNSVPALDFLDNSAPTRRRSHSQGDPGSNVPSSSNNPFEALDLSPTFPSFVKKRAQESDSSSGDRRHKRMIKNRESAARSRARKQAYTNELELGVAQLLEENEKLKKQQKELCLAAVAQLPKKHTLCRTSTAPF